MVQAHRAVSAVPWDALGSRQRVGATHVWTTLLAHYAQGGVHGTDVVQAVYQMHELGHHDPAPVQLAVAMLHTLPHDTRTHEMTLLVDGARRYPHHPWFAVTLAVRMSRHELDGEADQPRNWMQRASQLDPRLAAAADRMRP